MSPAGPAGWQGPASPALRQRYIAVEGPIGVGKTTLARRLAAHLQAELVLEDFAANPFLARFYRDMPRWAFATQMAFLFQRSTQLAALKQPGLFDAPVVADFLLDKDPLFARLTLAEDEYALYEQVYRHLAPQAARPDLVIYLQAPASVLIERVQRRGLDLERPIGADYLANLASLYADYFHAYDATPLLIVNAAHLNFADSDEDFAWLLERVAGMRGPREFFNRG